MNQKRFLAVVLAALCAAALLSVSSNAQRRQSRPPAPTPKPKPTPASWPNLDVLKPWHGLNVNSCGLDGFGKPGTEKAKSNELKNRYHLPGDPFKEVTFADLLAFNQGHVSTDGTKVVGFPDSSDTNNNQAVSIVGYVIAADASGCAVRKNNQGVIISQGESCNCDTADKTECDTHIQIVLDPNGDHKGGKGVVVVEVTERSRRLAAMGLLDAHNPIGRDWTSATLHNTGAIKNHWVRFYGWLFYDADHFDAAWAVDPTDSIGGPNFRQTAWEVHPVMGIEVLPGPPPSVSHPGR